MTSAPSGRVLAGAAAAVVAALVITSCGGPDADPTDSASDEAAAVAPDLGAGRASWSDGVATASGGALVQGRVDLDPATTRVTIALDGGFPVAIPPACRQSNVKLLESYLDDEGTLVCAIEAGRAPDQLAFTALVDGEQGSTLGGLVTTEVGDDSEESQLPERVVAGGAIATPDLRLVSSPDFLNADVGDLSKGPGRWTPQRSANGTSPSYESVLASILDDWKALDPAAVLVAGDLVNGRWGFDDEKTGNFGPVDSTEHKRAAYRRAARTYYPQWQQRFDDRGLAVFPTIGDHEYGDNPFSPGKRLLVDTMRREFARQFTLDADGSPRYADRPKGPARLTAFAGRPTPDLQIVSLDVFDITRERARIRIDKQQMQWLKGVLDRANRDKVKWIIVESHVPIAYPVRNRASSALHYENGTDSNLWNVLVNKGVDLYLSGEVHDTQLVSKDGIVQVSHGGAFQYGLTTALVLDFYGDNLYLTLRDYDVTKGDVDDRLWETRRGGLPDGISVGRDPLVIGTASVGEGGLVSASGILTPVKKNRR